MKYSILGNTELKVSRICLGTMTYGEQNTEAQAHEQLDYALSQGINFIDTAEMYSVPPKAETYGLTETYIGTWLKKRQDRDKIILATKVAGPGEIANYVRGGPRLNRDNIRQAVDASLQRLQTDYIDLYQVHWPDRQTNFFGQLGYIHNDSEESTPIEETLSALGELVQAGKIRYVGVSNETPWGVMTYLKLTMQRHLPRLVSIQNPYNLLNRTYEVGLAEISHREKVSLLAYSPLAFGALSGKYLNGVRPAGARLTLFERFDRYTKNEYATQAVQAYVALAKKYGFEPAQMALAYVNSRPFLTSNIIGATTMEQLKTDIASIDMVLNDELLEDIEAIHQKHSNPCP
ncbi:MAG: NADP(H)-dependent aldo-keto reductase [Gammaproteobacteria bacterium]|nr:MAG: NADP(H)-dependent aldo-keto reductase [Gammaproteobacteria bacterium]RKZ43106.1 MAG: NADP(H)-dependent aldo-keto reductase [Gammaproteobacteria bacterium]RKZ77351.1 MAG: NADP(H)-dependent aldo-keto reductase [Gammaproteobacteria bacterium]